MSGSTDLLTLLHLLILVLAGVASVTASLASVVSLVNHKRIQKIEVKLNGHIDELVQRRVDDEIARRTTGEHDR